MPAIIEIDGLEKRYGDRTVLDALSLDIGEGVFALLGPNGSGKTTLVSILTTLLYPEAGTARILGHDVTRERTTVRRLIAATGQYASIDEMLTSRENLTMLGRLLGLAPRRASRRTEELLDAFELEDAADRPVSGFSGGMRRRLDLAASIIRTPAVLFLDEPSTGLDPMSRTRLWAQIAELATEGCTVFLTTQMLDEAEALADRVAVLRDGTIVADGTVDALKRLVGGQTAVLVDDDDVVQRTFETDGSAASVAELLQDLPEHERRLRLEFRSPTLDDAFIALTDPTNPGRSAQEAAA
ncbi:ATP-binding cassette domain-containing protein [Pseudoclavibacter chungangensis]|uniref:ATP-binding cassette domain-containing protein n=1 Tax=Pseudoclavibacter chungangensis TaxID=587635 RepID=A0A7J5BQ58_9MICO|nr:ATP-binding cassette domain-containing protein [Pseudoclavibacter chungangensis]KAB1652968.1 ATP-binding cassette domain-containing protein [Pseudoclavibacter chungangensis]NYJ65232.1 ABC-type multidrug transport system ATPase subunit [Pseudoclavibacter chungangensis]